MAHNIIMPGAIEEALRTSAAGGSRIKVLLENCWSLIV